MRKKTLESSLENLWEKYKYESVTCLLAAFAAYMFAFTNKIPNWDDTQYLFSKGASLSSGRWGLDVLSHILPNISIPWFWGWASVLILIPAVWILLDLFGIQNRSVRCILAAVIITFPSEAGVMLYMFTSTSYAIAFLCAVSAVALYQRNQVGFKIMAIGLAVFSVSIYQAYIAITASLFIVLMIQMLLRGKAAAEVFWKGSQYLILLVISLLVYCVITFILLNITNTTLNGWAVQATTTTGGILFRMIRSWKLFAAMFLFRDYGLITSNLSWVAHIVCLLFVAFSVVEYIRKRRSIIDAGMLCFLGGILLPLSINAMVLLIGENGVHALTLYSFISVYVLLAVMLDGIGQVQTLRTVNVLALAVILLSNVYAANKAYLHQYMVYENTTSFYTSIVTQIQMTPGFDENSKIAIIGNIESDSSYLSGFGQEPIYGLNGFKGSVISDEFITRYLGTDFDYASSDEIEAIRDSLEFAQMQTYPYYGYIREINQYIVVKIGE